MPNYKGHLVGGAGSFILLLILVSRYTCPSCFTTVEWLGCALAGSLFPDIDIKSKGQKYFYRIIFIGLVLLAVQRNFELLVIVSLFAMIPMLVNHRGLFHRAWFIILLPLFIWHLVSLSAPTYKEILFFDVSFFIGGALSHLWLDVGIRRMFRL